MNENPPAGYVMRIVATTLRGILDEPEYLVEWDVNGMDGIGYAVTEPDLQLAHVFPDLKTTFETWKTQSTVKPLREWDGKPNRPLTAFTFEPAAVDRDRHGKLTFRNRVVDVR